MENLSSELINERSKSFDFYNNAFGEIWQVGFELTDEEIQNEDWIPMMNFIYPLPDNWTPPENIKKLFENIALTVVYLMEDDQYYLALTGGGMDLSWDICKAYIRLGFLPPTEFCYLPNFAGMKLTKENKQVIEACKRSCEIIKKQGTSEKERLEWLEKKLAKN